MLRGFQRPTHPRRHLPRVGSNADAPTHHPTPPGPTLWQASPGPLKSDPADPTALRTEPALAVAVSYACRRRRHRQVRCVDMDMDVGSLRPPTAPTPCNLRWETDSSRPCEACSSCAHLASSHRSARRRDVRYSMPCCTHRRCARDAAPNALAPFSCQATTRRHHLAAAAASLQRAARRGARRSGIACLTFQRRGCGACRGAPRL